MSFFINFLKRNFNKLSACKIILALTSCFLLAGQQTAEAQAQAQAQSQVAVTTGSVNLRQGPGSKDKRITVLPRGAAVHIQACQKGWCHIATSWGTGWVSGRYLGNLHRAAPVYRPVYTPPPQVHFGLNIGPDDYYDDPFYGPDFWPPYGYWNGPDYWPQHNPLPSLRHHWNPRWGVGPVRPPRLR